MEQRIDLDALEAALGKSTPGEWEACRYSNYSGWAVYAPEAGCIAERWYSTGQQDEIPRNDQFIALAHNALPALIAELRELRARTTPEVIGKRHQNRRLWLVCVPEFDGWQEAKWEPTSELWVNYYGRPIFGTPTHALPMPGEPEDA